MAARQESIAFAGHSAFEAQQRIVAELAEQADVQVASGGEGSVQVLRTYRPTWALVAGILGIAFGGLGALLLFVRRTDTCSILVVNGATGAMATLTGVASASLVAAVHSAADGGAQLPGGPPSASSTPVGLVPGEVAPAPRSAGDAVRCAVPLAAEETIVRGGSPRPETPLQLRFPDGRVANVEREVLVGRSPVAGPKAGARLVEVDDPTRTVSKTHLAVRARDGLLWLEDLNSTNGTVVEHQSGSSVTVRPGSPERLLPGSVVVFGDQRFEVVAAG